MYNNGNRKRYRQPEKSVIVDDKLHLQIEKTVGKNDVVDLPKSLDYGVLIEYLKQLGTDFKSTRVGSVYVKVEVGVAECRYIEENMGDITAVVVDQLKVVDMTISPVAIGAIDRYVTIHGKIHTVLRAALYLVYLVRAEVNNMVSESLTLKTVFSLVVILADEMTRERVGNIERRAKFKAIPYYELVKVPYQSTTTVTKLASSGNFKSLFDFLVYVIETSEKSEKYVDDGLIVQYPTMKADDSNLFQQQDFNRGKLEENIKQALKGKV